MQRHLGIIRQIIALSILLLSLTTGGYCDCQVTLQWAPSLSPEGHRLYGRETDTSYNYDEPWWEGDQSFTQCTIDQLDEDTTYYFVIRAYDAENNESENSNEVAFKCIATSANTPSDSDSDSIEDTNASSLSDGSAVSTSGGSGGGGGGGCFITTLNNL